MKKCIFAVLMIIFLASTAKAVEGPMFTLCDPVGDDHGPGYYKHPTGAAFKSGSFDLVSFEVTPGEKTVRLKFKFASPVRSASAAKSPYGGELQGEVYSNFYLQNLEVYIDKDHLPGIGEIALLPGRGAFAAKQSQWEQAVLITPMPSLAKKELKSFAPELEGKVLIPDHYVIQGDSVYCAIPISEIGVPQPFWGYIVIVTPADFGEKKEKPSFSLSADAIREPFLMLRPVKEREGEWDFGGGDPSGISPNIIDVIVSSSESHEKVLSSYNLITRSRVQLTAVYPLRSSISLEAHNTLKSRYSIEATIFAVASKKVTIDKGARDGIYAGMIGRVVDEYGDEITNVVVDEVYDTYSVCKILKVAMISYVAERMKVFF
jgi:hypothetical protein